MKIVILCGGQGTRIRGVSDNLPKPMIPIGDFPILWHLMKSYAAAGHNEFILCLGYKGHVIKEFFLNYEAFTNDFTLTLGRDKEISFHGDHDESGWKVTCAETGADTMTGGRIKRIKRYIGDDEHFMLTYGDGLGNVNLNALIDYHKSHGKVLTVTGVRPPGRFGEMESNNDGQVLEFNEKPQASGGRISGGFFVCRREIFDYLDDSEDLVFENDPMRTLARDENLMVFKHDGFWQCMDTYRDYTLLNNLWDTGELPWRFE
ncbi:MAG: glucose-1-phosphate cytidylyltransferase [Rhodospirillaceae bacterium]|jgi:glucose-1-phosphate cytidylyltransferase|nr:glucose-1-phosphate cytidylyltransferase [Rhodospirillaceae bacterium]